MDGHCDLLQSQKMMGGSWNWCGELGSKVLQSCLISKNPAQTQAGQLPSSQRLRGHPHTTWIPSVLFPRSLHVFWKECHWNRALGMYQKWEMERYNELLLYLSDVIIVICLFTHSAFTENQLWVWQHGGKSEMDLALENLWLSTFETST